MCVLKAPNSSANNHTCITKVSKYIYGQKILISDSSQIPSISQIPSDIQRAIQVHLVLDLKVV